MIITMLMNVGLLIVAAIFTLLDVLPNLPANAITLINDMFDMMKSGIGLFGIFFDIGMVKILFPIVVAIMNFEKIYWLILWILNKIPFIDID